jgi:acetyl-CoA carboxylase, biotin carboxylase subunit
LSIRRILVANRGEIAARIIRTCRKLGIETVLAASEADRDSLPARLATRALCIGPAHPTDSYLKPELQVQAALGTGCDAIHPGYGFLSERAAFARLCEQNGVTFIGPTSEQLAIAGDKLAARAAAQSVDVPLAPGGEAPSREAARELAARIGMPLLVKAAGGGGGRGMKLVERIEDLDAALELAAAEAGAAFGDARVYLERFVARARHVEVQVLGDGAGNMVHLGERDCSVQRRYQKIIEETPAPGLADGLRSRLHDAALRFAGRLRYRGAGTVEFLVDAERGEFYFLEMNARIQVEHPVTELVSGVDIVAAQIAIASGNGLRLVRGEAWRDGCAIECRINAEDPARDFAPSPGTARLVRWPNGDGIRVDTHIESGARVPPFYDSLLGKIIAHGRDRAQALARLRAAVSVTRIDGIQTNLALHAEILADPEFMSGGVDTGYLARLLGKRPARAAVGHHG